MTSFLQDNDDLRYYLEKAIDWKTLADVTERGFIDADRGGFSDTEEAVEFYSQILEMVGEFVADEIAPHAAELDRDGVSLVDGEVVFPPRLQSIFDKIHALELHGMCVPRELGGMNIPMMVYFLNSELFARAEVSVMSHHGFHGGIAMAMLFFSLREGSCTLDPTTGRILDTKYRDAISEIANGKAWGCMDITEPDAGSDMAKLRARGELDEDGNWFVTGEKIYITSGHGKYHYVIARTEESTGEPGLEGLSMFMVPTYEDLPDGTRRRIVEVTRIEEKLGHHSSATCALLFDRAPAELIGKRGEGFKYMLLLMNNARVGVGFECVGLCEAAYRMAADYAAGRHSMGKSIDRHEMIADYLDEMRTDIQALRAITVRAAFNEELSQKLQLMVDHQSSLSTDEREEKERLLRRAKRITRRLTPLLKYFGAEKAVEMSRRSVQIHGGNGYTKDYGAEKLLRDSLVMPIYEGTSQIQALMAMKDCMSGILKSPQRFVRRLAKARWRSISANDELERRVAKLQVLSMSTQQHLLLKTAGNKLSELRGRPLRDWPETFMKDWDPKRDFSWALLHAENLIRILCDEAICEELLTQAQAHPERADILLRYIERAEPRVRYWADLITTTGQRLIETLDAISDEEDAATESADAKGHTVHSQSAQV